MFRLPEKYRAKNNRVINLFIIPLNYGIKANVIASNGEGWEHVSVTLIGLRYSPNWEQMCFIKSIFWEENDVVIQYHPAKKDYVNNHPFCLHLWRPIGQVIPTPDPILVGLK